MTVTLCSEDDSVIMTSCYIITYLMSHFYYAVGPVSSTGDMLCVFYFLLVYFLC